VAKHLKEGRLKEAIALSSAKEYRYSHLAKVVLAGLQEYQFQQESGSGLSREDMLDTVRRSIQRATALTSNDLKKGVSGLATIGATAPFVGLLGTVVGVINAFVGIASTGSGGIGAVSAGIAEALVETALGLFVAIPAVWFYNYLSGRLEYFNVEMDNSSSEMVDYFIKKTAVNATGGAGFPGPCLPSCDSNSRRTDMAMDIGGAKGGVKSDINVTPLVDVMLVLLIIMMIVAPLLQKGATSGCPSQPTASDKPETQDQTVVAITRRRPVLRQRRASSAKRNFACASKTSSRASPNASSSSRPMKTPSTAPSWTRWTSCARR
jgi:biopolymer transport protein ExbB